MAFLDAQEPSDISFMGAGVSCTDEDVSATDETGWAIPVLREPELEMPTYVPFQSTLILPNLDPRGNTGENRIKLTNPYRGRCGYSDCARLVDPRNDGFYFVAVYQVMKFTMQDIGDMNASLFEGRKAMMGLAKKGPAYSPEFSRRFRHKHIMPDQQGCVGSESLRNLLQGHNAPDAEALSPGNIILLRVAYSVLQSAEIYL